MLICANCGRENPRGARFCLGCGTSLAPAGAAEENPAADHETGEPASRLPAGAAPGEPAEGPGALPGALIDGVRCFRCATINPQGMSFCRNCGSGLDAAGAALQVTPPARAPGAGPEPGAPPAAAPARPSPAQVPAGAAGSGSGAPEPAESSARPPRRMCPHCGAKTPTGYAFCQHCGKNLPSVSEAVRTGALISGETGGEEQGEEPAAAPVEPAPRVPRPARVPELTPVPVPIRQPAARTPTPPSGMPVAVRAAATAGATRRATPGVTMVPTSRRPTVPARKPQRTPVPRPAPETTPTPFPLAKDATAAAPPAAVEPGPHGDAAWGMLVLMNPDGSDGARFPLSGEWVDIGRAHADICFAEDRFLAAPHLRLARVAGAARAIPLDTLNGVFRRVREPVEVDHGDVLLVGQELLRFELVDDDEREAAPLLRHGVALFGSPLREPWGRLMHLLASGGVSDVRHLHEPVVTIGREEGAVTFPDDAFMSRRHASLSWSDDRCMVDDLGSSNGTFVRLAGPVEIRTGDTLRVGDHLLRLELG